MLHLSSQSPRTLLVILVSASLAGVLLFMTRSIHIPESRSFHLHRPKPPAGSGSGSGSDSAAVATSNYGYPDFDSKVHCSHGGAGGTATKFYSQYGQSLTKYVRVHRRCVQVEPTLAGSGKKVTKVQEPLISQDRGSLVSLDPYEVNNPKMLESYPAIRLTVPKPFPRTTYPQLLFGLATSFERLQTAFPDFVQWAGHTEARIVVLIPEIDAIENEHAVDQLLAEADRSGLDLVLKPPMDPSVEGALMHFSMIRDVLEQKKPETKWVGVIDDDTFFASLFPLVSILNQYDASKPHYLGALTEELEALAKYGTMAYGGAGAFLSLPLAQQLEPVIELCLEKHDIAEGDGMLNACIRSETDTRLTVVDGLWQTDMEGNIDGWYESGRYQVSTHHWKSRFHVPMGAMTRITNMCGTCFLQRWQFGDDTVLHNGYSIAIYEGGLADIDLDKLEPTFNKPDDFEWSIGPFRHNVDPARKKSFYLIDTEEIDNTHFRQFYVHKGRPGADIRRPPREEGEEGEGEESEEPLVGNDAFAELDDERYVDEVIELWWEYQQ